MRPATSNALPKRTLPGILHYRECFRELLADGKAMVVPQNAPEDCPSLFDIRHSRGAHHVPSGSNANRAISGTGGAMGQDWAEQQC